MVGNGAIVLNIKIVHLRFIFSKYLMISQMLKVEEQIVLNFVMNLRLKKD